MWTTGQKIAYLKVLTALAWTDGNLSRQELNYIKNISIKFGLSDREKKQLDPFFYDAVTADESRRFIEDFLASIVSEKDRQELIKDLRQMAESDKEITREEQNFLDEATRLIENSSSIDALTGSFKKIFSFESPQVSADYIRNKILYKLKRRIEQGKMPPIEENRLTYIALFGGLLGRVAFSDFVFSEKELNFLKRELIKAAGFSAQEAELTAEVIKEAVVSGVDYAAMIADFFHNSTEAQRHQLVECLFALSLEDGKMSNEEIEEIRSIATGLGLSHKAYINAKMKAMEDLKM